MTACALEVPLNAHHRSTPEPTLPTTIFHQMTWTGTADHTHEAST